MKNTILSSVLAFSLTATAVSAQVIVNEDFESYGSTAAMLTNWSGGVGTLDTGFGNPGQSAAHAGTTVNTWSGSAFSIAPTPTEFVRLSFDLYDDASSANKSLTVGLRGGPFPLLELGMYNTTPHYAFRVTGFPGGPGWVSLSALPVAGWHHFTADIYDNQTVISLDLNGNGSVDFTQTTVGVTAGAFTDLRFGGPSNASSPGGDARFDNIRLEVLAVPEPTILTLLGLGSAGLLLLRRRR